MERIELYKPEKIILRATADEIEPYNLNLDRAVVRHYSRTLRAKGLIDIPVKAENDWRTTLTDYGRTYIAQNPHLFNPIDWKYLITTAIAVIALGISIYSLFKSGC